MPASARFADPDEIEFVPLDRLSHLVERASHGSAADFDGDGTGDIAIFRTSLGLWSVRGITRVYYEIFGLSPVERARKSIALVLTY